MIGSELLWMEWSGGKLSCASQLSWLGDGVVFITDG